MHRLDTAVELPSLRRAGLADNMALDIAVLPGIAVLPAGMAVVEGAAAAEVLVAVVDPFFYELPSSGDHVIPYKSREGRKPT